MDNLKENFDGISFWLNGNSESEILPIGTYLMSAYHNGNFDQNIIAIITVASYDGQYNNRWLPCRSLVSDFTAYSFEYNPYLRKIRNPSNVKKYLNLKLINNYGGY